ncbi:hypothetical protein NPX13_g11061 [Xylaria arbuscula]|uniref:Isopropylmalate dehydrogenase-like domain-containing protein n=1 Tax=Xylaria arbuscula TaxID=114810 RepID=A0A9W8TG83_9PEZI|nr:hypothetical protein NPX13_g11061 [Xylaria arbuscula]
MLVDAMTVRMVNNSDSIDTVVGTNLHIDILSDLAAALAGSIGIASSSNLDPTRQNPSLFEPVHGSAFDITGMGIANPIGAVASACDMLSWLGETGASAAILSAVQKSVRDGVVTKDMGGSANTLEVAMGIIERL